MPRRKLKDKQKILELKKNLKDSVRLREFYQKKAEIYKKKYDDEFEKNSDLINECIKRAVEKNEINILNSLLATQRNILVIMLVLSILFSILSR